MCIVELHTLALIVANLTYEIESGNPPMNGRKSTYE